MSVDLEAQALADLLRIYREPESAAQLTLPRWDPVLRLGRRAGILGRLHARLTPVHQSQGALPEKVWGHLQAACIFSNFRHQQVRAELRELASVVPESVQVVLLKGGAYLFAEDHAARGRLPSDVDILVRRSDLDLVEKALLAEGWAFERISAYDDRYYREWSHELPPLRRAAHPLEVDLHRSITPVVGRIRPDLDALFRDILPIADSRWWVLSPIDRIIHATIHLFQDSDLNDGFRHLLDISNLIEQHIVPSGQWQALLERASLHDAVSPLLHALHFCHAWLGMEVPSGLRDRKQASAGVELTRWVFARTALPHLPDRAPGFQLQAATWLGLARYHLLRMPPNLLVKHLAIKGLRRLDWRKPA